MKAYLIDGDEIVGTAEIENLEELEELNERAKEATDGNLHWTAVI